ncbi:SGNH/GDSL hydrolase family protein [Streptomyces sp. Je 1-79]|uniref:SGNH/GDSL hydrolase family protein n=1 Tax=Streptomyces sp. Je 1-79 TaxID=2943847 RepID=UPI0021A8F370|nr:SGNH/GDSL hydrolase family protein [Streptomyces sp. Je 1-79]MCT4356495.1 SGNH/GDSL hydrolase family protein [Streptomyces sp. Je 1-79]
MTITTTPTPTTTTALRRAAVAAMTAAALTALPLAGSSVASEHRPDHGTWRGAWATSPHAPTAPLGPNWSQQGFSNHTVRQVVRVTTGGTKARIELSNRHGTTPLRITGATVARTDKGASVKAGSVRQLSFGKGRSVTIPAGGTALSDGVPFPVKALESVTVTLYLAAPTGPATFHHFASATSYRADGDHRSDRDGTAFTESSESWYYLTGVEVSGGAQARRDGIVTFGDSITDGVGSVPDANNRYPDELAERLAAAGKPRSVLNHGIGGNQVTNDTTWAGEKGIERFKKDVLSEPGVRTVILLEGINDFGGSLANGVVAPTPEVSVEQLVQGHRSLIRQAHAKGIKVVGATLTPVEGSFYDTPAVEAKRDAFNHWVRTSGAYDAVVDFDRAVADPADPDRILPAYDSGDHLHPGDAGYRAMAEALDLDAL